MCKLRKLMKIILVINKISSDKQDGMKKISIPDEGIKALKELGDILLSIHKRIVLEGFEFKDSSITKKSTQ